MGSAENVTQKINKIQYINNILPKILYGKSIFEFIEFADKKIKTSYLIDLTSHLISRYFLTNDNLISLSSKILRKRYGEHYNWYVSYLCDKEIIKLKKNHFNGKNCRVYEFNHRILHDDLQLFQNFDKFLLKKNRFDGNEIFEQDLSQNHILDFVKLKLIKDLYKVVICTESSDYLFKSIIFEKHTLICNRHSVECINNQQLFYHFDRYGRMHTNFTNLKSIIRKQCLILDGSKTKELDIKNSQPLFLNKLIETYQNEFEFDQVEIGLYKKITLDGNFYSYLMGKFNTNNSKKVKDIVYKILFGKNFPNKYELEFESLFPTIHKFIKYFKKKSGGYKYLSHKLQNLESELIYNKIIREIMSLDNNIPIITVHDSIICREQDFDLVKSIFDKKILDEFGYMGNSNLEDEFNIYRYEQDFQY